MEKISTSRAALLPRAANLATLTVVVAATWWSGAQRPVAQPGLAADRPARVVALTDAGLQQPAPALGQAAQGAAAPTAVSWPAQAAATVAREGLQTVGYQTRAQR